MTLVQCYVIENKFIWRCFEKTIITILMGRILLLFIKYLMETYYETVIWHGEYSLINQCLLKAFLFDVDNL